jgi:hypothetical protein
VMCGRIVTCLLIGVELVSEGCGLSLNRTQKRGGGELSVPLFYTIRSRCHEQCDGRNVEEVLKSPAVEMC